MKIAEIEYLSNYIDRKFKSRRSALESEREFEVDRTKDKNLPAFKSKLNRFIDMVDLKIKIKKILTKFKF